MSLKPLKLIAVSRENYLALKKLGLAGDSFNDVISEILEKQKTITVNASADQNKEGEASK